MRKWRENIYAAQTFNQLQTPCRMKLDAVVSLLLHWSRAKCRKKSANTMLKKRFSSSFTFLLLLMISNPIKLKTVFKCRGWLIRSITETYKRVFNNSYVISNRSVHVNCKTIKLWVFIKTTAQVVRCEKVAKTEKFTWKQKTCLVVRCFADVNLRSDRDRNQWKKLIIIAFDSAKASHYRKKS
jgi:hypothetical protein